MEQAGPTTTTAKLRGRYRERAVRVLQARSIKARAMRQQNRAPSLARREALRKSAAGERLCGRAVLKKPSEVDSRKMKTTSDRR